MKKRKRQPGKTVEPLVADLLALAGESESESELGHVAPGFPETPLVNEFLALRFYDPDCHPLLRSVLGKPLGERSEEEHAVFSGFLIGVLEESFRGDLDELRAKLRERAAR
jgi:hypothetical protein